MNAITQNSAAATPVDTTKGWKISTAGRSLDVLSKQWIARPADDRFTSLDDLRDAMKEKADRTTEAVLGNRELKIISPEILPSDDRASAASKMNQLRVVDKAGQEFAPTNWAFGQVAALAKAPGAWLATLPGAIASTALQYALHYQRGAADVKLYADDLEALAITGPNYGRIMNYEVVEARSEERRVGKECS